jgi:hypothetical protein
MPYSSRAKIEIARSYFLLEDRDKAVALLKQVCLSETSFLPAWKYLLRLLALQKAGEGVDWCKKADAGFPRCYSLSLIGLDNYSPEEKPGALLEILSRVGSTFSMMERPFARDVLSKAFFAIVALPLKDKSPVIALLRKAHEVFPESTRIVAELGKVLYAAGKGLRHRSILTSPVPKKLPRSYASRNIPPRKFPTNGSFHDSFARCFHPDQLARIFHTHDEDVEHADAFSERSRTARSADTTVSPKGRDASPRRPGCELFELGALLPAVGITETARSLL